MPKFVVEREIPGAGGMTPEQVCDAAKKSLSVLHDLGSQIQWIHSYVTDHKVYCISWAPNAEIIQEHPWTLPRGSAPRSAACTSAMAFPSSSGTREKSAKWL
jgi:hypothetical protein